MWFEMQYHINQSLNVTVPIPVAFTQAEGKAAVVLVWIGGDMCVCVCVPLCFWVVNKYIFMPLSIHKNVCSCLCVDNCLNHMLVLLGQGRTPGWWSNRDLYFDATT